MLKDKTSFVLCLASLPCGVSFQKSPLASFSETKYKNVYKLVQQRISVLPTTSHMPLPSQIIQAIKLKIIKIRQKLSELAQSSTYQSISRSYSETSTCLLYLLKVSSRLNDQDFNLYLQECFKFVRCLVEATEFQKYGHRFPLFAFIIRRFQRYSLDKVSRPSSQLVLKRVEKNQQSQLFTSLRSPAILLPERNFLSSPEATPSLTAMTNNELVLQNPQCICCSQVFIKDLPVKNLNPSMPRVIPLSGKKGFDQLTLSKYLTSLCNSEGGVILIGAEVQDNQVRATGVNFKNREEIEEKEKEILAAIHMIRTKFHCTVKRVLVHTNYINNQNVQDEYLRYCFRILIVPEFTHKIAYLQMKIKGYESQYEIYKLDESGQPMLAKKTPNSADPLYSFILDKYQYKKKEKRSNSHQNVQCLEPHHFYSRAFSALEQQGLIRVKEKGEEMEEGDDEKRIFKYSNTCLLAVACKKHQRQIQNFMTILTKYKILYKESQPFQDSFKNCSRFFVVMSHQIQLQKLKQHLFKAQKQGKVKPQIITIMPVEKVLQIDLAKLKGESQTQLQKKFTEYYGHSYGRATSQVQDKSGKMKTILYLIFNGFSESIFAYMAFEELGLRPYFVKEKSANYQLQKQ